MRRGANLLLWQPATALWALLLWATPCAGAAFATAKQRSLDEWRSLTTPTAPAPRVFVKGDNIRFYFQGKTSLVAFRADWSRLRVPTAGYKINSALLRLDGRFPRLPGESRRWQEATVIAGREWARLATNLVTALTPRSPGHGIYYQGFLADRLWYRDDQGRPHFTAIDPQPKGLVIDRYLSMEETLQMLARCVEENLEHTYPSQSLFLLMPPNATRFTHPLLLDRKQRQCVWLAPAALYDTTERGLGLSVTAQGISALLLEGHGLALLRNPVSSVARLGDLGLQTVLRFLRLPSPGRGSPMPVCTNSTGMDLVQWESWLDHYTGTRRQNGSLKLLIDGEQFFPRLKQALAEATNHIHFDVYIFDKDDVAVGVADQLKQRSRDIEVKVILDRLSSIAAGLSPPATAMPEDFTPPSSIISYLRDDSKVHVRPFLNPWFSSDHSKVILVDGARAWLGGMNIGREYRFEWHDLMVELEGPVVGSLEDGFRRDWAHAGPLGDLAYFSTLLSTPKRSEAPPVANHWIKVRLLPTRTAWKPFAAAVMGSIRKARRYIYIEHPYLFDTKVIHALVSARNRGVDVRVILPRVNDFKAGGRSNLIIANYLLEHGVRVYFYPGMTHVKAMMVDDWACLGSGNLNNLSLRLCQEQNVATSDPAFASRLKRELFEEDFARSDLLTEPIAVDWVDFLSDQLLVDF